MGIVWLCFGPEPILWFWWEVLHFVRNSHEVVKSFRPSVREAGVPDSEETELTVVAVQCVAGKYSGTTAATSSATCLSVRRFYSLFSVVALLF